MGDVADGRFLETDIGEKPRRDVGDAIIWVLLTGAKACLI